MNGRRLNPPWNAYCEAYQKVLRMFCRNNIIPLYQTEAVRNSTIYDKSHNLPEQCGKLRSLWNRKSENSGILWNGQLSANKKVPGLPVLQHRWERRSVPLFRILGNFSLLRNH